MCAFLTLQRHFDLCYVVKYPWFTVRHWSFIWSGSSAADHWWRGV